MATGCSVSVTGCPTLAAGLGEDSTLARSGTARPPGLTPEVPKADARNSSSSLREACDPTGLRAREATRDTDS